MNGGDKVVASKSPFLPQQWRLQAFPLQGKDCYMYVVVGRLNWFTLKRHFRVHNGTLNDDAQSWAVESSKPYTPVRRLLFVALERGSALSGRSP